MGLFQKRVTWHFSSGLCASVLVLLLATSVLLAFYSITGKSGLTVTCTSKPSTTTPTLKLPTFTPTTMQTYTGQGFTIRYSVNWVVQSTSMIELDDPQSASIMFIVTHPNSCNFFSADTAADSTIKGWESGMRSSQSVNMPTTVTITGLTWSQRAMSGTEKHGGIIEAVILTINYPTNAENTKVYTIIYSTDLPLFNQISKTYFIPMIHSFKFTA